MNSIWRKYNRLTGFEVTILGTKHVVVTNPNWALSTAQKNALERSFSVPYKGAKLTVWQKNFIARSLRDGWYGICNGSERCILIGCMRGYDYSVDVLAHEVAHAVENLITADHESTEAGAIALSSLTLPFVEATFPKPLLLALKGPNHGRKDQTLSRKTEAKTSTAKKAKKKGGGTGTGVRRTR